ncbi:MAG TPA: tRNA (guanosine(46)-N7)-methyltransferase TrmB [Clostridiaceae bacterium]|jgi:tRNA (guanine-N7-)-methyltransferase|nr:tRNA (guanosine(46)-N7)-methyltransferase TrmB [Clostridiaceae bacterium]
MRLRNVPNAHEKLSESTNYIRDPQAYKGRWNEYFKNDNPIYMEIGSGKGQFIIRMASENPDINFIALEKSPVVLLQLIKKIPSDGLVNLAVISFDAEKLEEIFDSGEINRLYLNFSDPWPKKRHAKRRLTSPRFLEIYKNILKPGSLIEFKTDNRDFFEYSLEEFRSSGYNLLKATYDLYNSDFLEGNIPTEYESKFHNMGVPINKLFAEYDPKNSKEEVSHN